MVYTIARDTGWDEDYIIYRLPMARAMQYYHCALQMANLWTLEIPTEESIAAVIPADLLAYIDTLDADEPTDFDLPRLP